MVVKLIFTIILFVLTDQKNSEKIDGKTAVLNYINNHLSKGEVGYGWEDQPDGHLTPTYAAIGVMKRLDELPLEKQSLIKFVRTHHPQRNPNNREAGPSVSEIRDLVYQQVQSLLWLGDDVSDFSQEVADWKSQQDNRANFERHGYPPFFQEMMTPVVRNMLNLPQDDRILEYIIDRRRANGSYNNAPARDGGDGNILNTYWGVRSYSLLQEYDELHNETIKWIQSCQTERGGFTHQPNPKIAVNDELAYTWAAVKALNLLGSQPDDMDAVIRYLLSLQNLDGGFGNRPGLPSTPMSTFYAIDTLFSLGMLSLLESVEIIYKKADQIDVVDYSGYNIYTVQFQAPGRGSPYEAVMLADSLKIHLWGAKNVEPGWIEAVQNTADEYQVPVELFHSNEDYGKHVDVEGMGSFNHVFDPIFPLERDYVSPRWKLRENYYFSWELFISDYVQPLFNDNGALLWQVNYNEPMARLLLDHSINENKGYIAISTVHFEQNFLFWAPYLYQYRYQMPFIALQDFHGEESWWWGNDLVSYRNLFLAKEPTYESMVEAVKAHRIVTVRHDALTRYRTRILGGAAGVQDYILSRKDEWKWWDDETQELNHPWAAITILKPGDVFEEAKPEMGVNIRIRCWWKGIKETLTKPAVDLVRLKINGKDVESEYFEKKNRHDRLSEAYYLYKWPDVTKGEHTIEATLKRIDDNTIKNIKVTFSHE